MIIQNYNYTEKEISFLLSDIYNGDYVWVGFKQDETTCTLKKVSANNPLQTYFSIDITTNEIKAGVISGSVIYIALDDPLLIAKRYSLTNPLTTYVDFTLPSGIDEAPIDILVSTYVYFLIPGNGSGKHTKIVKMTTAGVYVETIDLPTIQNASSFINVGTEFWVTTYTNPAKYIRVFFSGTWQYTINS